MSYSFIIFRTHSSTQLLQGVYNLAWKLVNTLDLYKLSFLCDRRYEGTFIEYNGQFYPQKHQNIESLGFKKSNQMSMSPLQHIEYIFFLKKRLKDPDAAKVLLKENFQHKIPLSPELKYI